MDLFDRKIQLKKKKLGVKMSREIQILDIRVNRACTESGLGTDKTKLESNAVGKVSESCHSLKSSKFLYM